MKVTTDRVEDGLEGTLRQALKSAVAGLQLPRERAQCISYALALTAEPPQMSCCLTVRGRPRRG